MVINDLNASIYIPTYKRIDRQITWHALSPTWQANAWIVCPMDEVEAHQAAGRNVIGTDAKGIGDTRQFILEDHDVENDGDYLIMMDDDLRFFERRDDDPKKFKPLLGRDHAFDQMMQDFMAMLAQGAFGGIANRSGAHLDTRQYRLNARLHDLMAFHVPTAKHIDLRLNRVEFMEDFDAALQFLTKGYPSLCLNSHCKDDIGGSNATGGCSEYRDLVGQAAAAYEMQTMWPDLVKAVVKKPTKNSTGWGGNMNGDRTDVRVQWAKAFKQGQQYRDLIGIPQATLPDQFMLI